jgi:hypothetical protein
MRLRDLQSVLDKFTDGQKGTVISDCPIYIETKDGYLEEVRIIELQQNRLINSPEPARIVLKAESMMRFRSITYKRLEPLNF